MIKLTELKRMIKTNNLNPAFYSEGLQNLIFNYNQQFIIKLKEIDQLKVFNFLKSSNITDFDYRFHENYFDAELKNKLDKIAGSTHEHIHHLVNTGIQFLKAGLFESDEKILYKVFKTEKGLMKIKDEYICVLNQDAKKGCMLKTNEAHSMVFIYNNTFDLIGVCMGEKFEMGELTEYTQWGS